MNLSEFASRQQALIQHVGSRGIAILFAATRAVRNGDSHYPFRQNSHFYYVTGFNEPDAIAVFLPGRSQGEYILFNYPRNPQRELWDGAYFGQEGACKAFGAAESFPLTDFASKLPELLIEREKLFMPLGSNQKLEQLVMQCLAQSNIHQKVNIPSEIINLEPFLGEMRLRKSRTEVAILQQAAEISAQAHRQAMKTAQPGLHEYHLEAALRYAFIREGAREIAYECIVGSGKNACTLHYRDNNKPLYSGELVLIDAGCELHYYAADITRTFPVNGRFSSAQKALYTVVLEAQLAGIEQVKPGTPWNKIQETIVQKLTQGLVDLGILTGDVAELINQKVYLPFYMHNSGHWVGLDVHDVGSYKLNGDWRLLEPGMVLTVEPGLYIQPQENVAKCWWDMGIRIEDVVLVTADGCEVLSKNVPKTVEEIERLMGS